MMRPVIRTMPSATGRTRAVQAFTLAELLVVAGIIALLIALLLPPLQLAKAQAMRATCAVHMRNLGHALENVRSEYGFYPLWDDGGVPVCYTWIDVLIQQRHLGTAPTADRRHGGQQNNPAGVGYCPADALPDPLNTVRHPKVLYPLTPDRTGVDYSYGISVPLASGRWAWHASGDSASSMIDVTRDTANRVLAVDAYTTRIYNLSGNAVLSNIWNDPTQYDNSVAWGRHGRTVDGSAVANLLYQDGHVVARAYRAPEPRPINSGLSFVLQPGESVYVSPANPPAGMSYPHRPPPNFHSNPPGSVFPNELLPYWYTKNHRWTLIRHK
jgi:prepilin-type processing-associated H-X9-DG protein